jgi:hypothetical protein
VSTVVGQEDQASSQASQLEQSLERAGEPLVPEIEGAI